VDDLRGRRRRRDGRRDRRPAAIVARRTMERDFTHIDPSGARVILLDAGERVVPAFSPTLSGRVAAGLRALGVTLREGARATGMDRDGVTARSAGPRSGSPPTTWSGRRGCARPA